MIKTVERCIYLDGSCVHSLPRQRTNQETDLGTPPLRTPPISRANAVLRPLIRTRLSWLGNSAFRRGKATTKNKVMLTG